LPRRGSLGAELLLVGVLAGLVSCSSPEPESSPWESWIEEARRSATTDFEREVLADGKVTDAELGEAFSRFTECMAAQGFTVEQTDYKGVYSGFFVAANGKDPDKAVTACDKGTMLLIEPLYHGMKNNPTGDDSSSRELDCLKERGLVPETFTVEDYAAASEQETLTYDYESEAALDCHYGV